MSGKRSSDEEASIKKPPQDTDEASTVSSETDGDSEKKEPLDPTRYGDWEKNGRCIDF